MFYCQGLGKTLHVCAHVRVCERGRDRKTDKETEKTSIPLLAE